MIKIQYNIDLAQYHTFAVPHRATALCTFENTEDIALIFKKYKNDFKCFLPIGEGSNLLFTKDFDGCLLKSTNYSINIESQTSEHTIIRVGSGLPWDEFVVWSIDNNYHGAENLSLIPGTIGASAVQNIGAYGADVSQIIDKVEGINTKTFEKQTFSNQECNFGYRSSIFKTNLQNQFIITHVYFKLALKENYKLDYGAVKQELEKLGEVTLQNIRKVIVQIREEKLPDPKVLANAGSFFKNPIVNEQTARKLLSENPGMPSYEDKNGHVKLAAGWLIDQCGLKGYQTPEGAAVHKHQALVLTNCGVSSGSSIVELANYVANCVYEKFAVKLSPEVTIIEEINE